MLDRQGLRATLGTVSAIPLLISIKSRKDYHRPPNLVGLSYDGGPALFLKILNTRGGNLITQLKLSTHHQSRFRDQKVHTTSTYLTKTAN